MKFARTLLGTAAAFATMFTMASAQATACSVTDLDPAALECTGFFNGNLLNDSPNNLAAQTSALASLGLTWDGSLVESLPLDGAHTVDFLTLLEGISYVGLHFGGGKGGPGNSTAFYRVDADTGLDTFTLIYNASSNARLYSTTMVPGVPEPETYALMLAGLGVVGFIARRRKQTA